MSLLSLIREQSAYLSTSDAAKHLNYRSLDISGESLNLSSEKVRELARSKELRHDKTSENGNYLFKVSWLEKYLKKTHGQAYTKFASDQNRFTEFDTNENAPAGRLGLVSSAVPSASVNTYRAERVPQKAKSDNFLLNIKNSPPLVYLSALTIGFVAGNSANLGQSLIDMGYFSDRVSVSATPIGEVTAGRLTVAIEKEDPDSALGSRLRKMEAGARGPFRLLEKDLRIFFSDTSRQLADADTRDFIFKQAAVVCDNSTIHGSKIFINASNINLAGQNANGLVEFKAFLKDRNVCAFQQRGVRAESVIVNRETFDREFQISTADKEFVDVVAFIDKI